jgi:hypothetical protein
LTALRPYEQPDAEQRLLMKSTITFEFLSSGQGDALFCSLDLAAFKSFCAL